MEEYEAPNKIGRPADHAERLEAAHPGLFDHSEVLPEAGEAERTNQQQKKEFVGRKDNQQRDNPHRDRAYQSSQEPTHPVEIKSQVG